MAANSSPGLHGTVQHRRNREPQWRRHGYWFGGALGELRAGVGLQVADIAASFGLDIEDVLARTLPDPDAS